MSNMDSFPIEAFSPAKPMNQAEEILTGLEQRIKDQIAAEYTDEARQEHVFNNMTVPELLNMLSYLFT